jgi:hypothetical protein
VAGRRTKSEKAATELARQAREGVLVPTPALSVEKCAACLHQEFRHDDIGMCWTSVYINGEARRCDCPGFTKEA